MKWSAVFLTRSILTVGVSLSHRVYILVRQLFLMYSGAFLVGVIMRNLFYLDEGIVESLCDIVP